MHRGRARRWATRVALAAVFSVAALGAWRLGAGQLFADIMQAGDIVWSLIEP
jgi:hypothetical protein